MQYRQDIVTRMLLYVSGVNYNVNSTVTIRSIWHNSATDFFGILENFRCKFANLVAQPTDRTTERLELCKVPQIL